MSWILPILLRLVFHEMPNSCIFKKPRIWQVFWYMTWYWKHIRKKYTGWRQVLWADALIQMPRKTPERNPLSYPSNLHTGPHLWQISGRCPDHPPPLLSMLAREACAQFYRDKNMWRNAARDRVLLNHFNNSGVT